MADDRRISGACTVHLARSGSLPMVQLAATLAPSDSATAQIYPWCRPFPKTPRGRGGVLPHVPPPWKFQNDSMLHYFFIFGQSSNWISSGRESGWTPWFVVHLTWQLIEIRLRRDKCVIELCFAKISTMFLPCFQISGFSSKINGFSYTFCTNFMMKQN